MNVRKIIQVVIVLAVIILCNIAYYFYIEVNPYLEWFRHNRHKSKRKGGKE